MKGVKFLTNAVCPKCGAKLYTESDFRDYSFQCIDCGENFYSMELAVPKDQIEVTIPTKDGTKEILSYETFRELEELGLLTFQIELENLLVEGEKIQTYALMNFYQPAHCIIDEDSTDYSYALEDTLHRILEAGGNESDVQRIMGASKENEEFPIDLGYSMPAILMMIKPA